MPLNLLLLQTQTPAASPYLSMLPLLLVFAIFYILLILPAQRQRKQQQKMLRELQNGNLVLTSGGIVGNIVAINDDDTLILRIKPDNIKLQVARSAVTHLVSGEPKK